MKLNLLELCFSLYISVYINIYIYISVCVHLSIHSSKDPHTTMVMHINLSDKKLPMWWLLLLQKKTIKEKRE